MKDEFTQVNKELKGNKLNRLSFFSCSYNKGQSSIKSESLVLRIRKALTLAEQVIGESLTLNTKQNSYVEQINERVESLDTKVKSTFNEVSAAMSKVRNFVSTVNEQGAKIT